MNFANTALKILHLDELSPELKDVAESSALACKKRRLEFLLARQAAKNAFKEFNVNFSFTTNSFKSGLQLPNNWLCSITHSLPYAAALVAPKCSYSFIGVDIEDITRKISSKFIQRIATKKEQDWIQGNPQKAIMLFSAKEALYKAKGLTENFSYQKLELVFKEQYFLTKTKEEIRVDLYKKDFVITYCVLT